MEIERGTMGRLPCAAVGSGPPVVVLAGLSPTTGVEGDTMVRISLAPFRALGRTHRLVLLNRWPGLPRGITMAELAAEHAGALRSTFGGPVRLAGISTGGSIAQQLAADHPDAVDRLVLVSTACRLSPEGRALQRRVALRVRSGATRRALAALMAGVVPPWRGRTLLGAAAWLAAPRVFAHEHDAADMAATIEAEDRFDLAACARPIAAPTLLLAGAEDRFYGVDAFAETARLIPGCDLRCFAGRGHVTVANDPGFGAALVAFLGPPAR